MSLLRSRKLSIAGCGHTHPNCRFKKKKVFDLFHLPLAATPFLYLLRNYFGIPIPIKLSLVISRMFTVVTPQALHDHPQKRGTNIPGIHCEHPRELFASVCGTTWTGSALHAAGTLQTRCRCTLTHRGYKNSLEGTKKISIFRPHPEGSAGTLHTRCGYLQYGCVWRVATKHAADFL